MIHNEGVGGAGGRFGGAHRVVFLGVVPFVVGVHLHELFLVLTQTNTANLIITTQLEGTNCSCSEETNTCPHNLIKSAK